MSEGMGEEGHLEPSEIRSPDFRRLEFPSDALSVKRFRILFPDRFDGNDDNIADGYASNDFFYPHSPDKPRHLVRLADMICDERIIADGAYKSCFVEQSPEMLIDEDREIVDDARKRLAESYLFFRLADSPETARLLIRQIEEGAESQARSRQQQHR